VGPEEPKIEAAGRSMAKIKRTRSVATCPLVLVMIAVIVLMSNIFCYVVIYFQLFGNVAWLLRLAVFARDSMQCYIACICRRNSVCLSLCLSATWRKLALLNLHCRSLEDSSFRIRKAFP